MADSNGGLAAMLQANRTQFLRLLKIRLGNSYEADDVFHDLWLKLQQMQPTAPVADPMAYLYRIVENAARDWHRSTASRLNLGRRLAARTEAVETDVGKPANPEQIAIDRDRLRQAEAALAALPERTRFILRAFRLDGRPQLEIAEELGISLSAVEKHLQRAYKALMLRDERKDAEKGGA